jgi:hypothetical protein
LLNLGFEPESTTNSIAQHTHGYTHWDSCIQGVNFVSLVNYFSMPKFSPKKLKIQYWSFKNLNILIIPNTHFWNSLKDYDNNLS